MAAKIRNYQFPWVTSMFYSVCVIKRKLLNVDYFKLARNM